MFTYTLHPAAEKEIKELPAKEHERIITKIKALCTLSHPLRSPNVVKLEGFSEPTYRLRVGNYRVKFIVHKSTVLFITHIEHRQAGY